MNLSTKLKAINSKKKKPAQDPQKARNILKRFSLFLLCLICFFVLERFCHRQTEGFRPHKILADLSLTERYSPIFPEDFDVNEIKRELNQPFAFLGSGGQCYTFLSSDQKYVLKVFKHHHMRANHLLNQISLPGKLDIYRKKLLGSPEGPEMRLKNFFTSCRIAFEELKEQTALIYLHLSRTHLFSQKITLIDKLGIAHQFNLDDLTFALQKKSRARPPLI